ncbi:MAG: aminotransferase [Deltaproteobacteria bacterium]|nr:MAG: aminotransferase [Deltaproteobacteria bacterium]
MRQKLVFEGADRLTYEIREIVQVANHLQSLGREITWENIGDPIHKGEQIPDWIKSIITELTTHNNVYGYVPTDGVLSTREFLVDQINQRGGCQITPEDLLFFNGLGDAVATIFGYLNKSARILCPSPAYPTHATMEAAHAQADNVTYRLDPNNNWMPDLDEIEATVKADPSIAGILIINPDNPTGTVYPRSAIERIVEIARTHDLFVIADEIYCNIVYNPEARTFLSEVIGDVPGIALQGISKEYPWPGSRCGWMEIFNKDNDPNFKAFIDSIRMVKMLEVCATSIPQHSIPLVMGDPRYPAHLDMRRNLFAARAQEAWEMLSSAPGVIVPKPQGAFYMAVIFENGLLNDTQSLAIEDDAIRRFVEEKVQGVAPDKRFTYYLLGAEGICVVPITGFCSDNNGFRITLLESDDEKRRDTWQRLVSAIERYTASGSR